MANEFARNQQDKLINPVAFALPAAASTSTTSAVVDFGPDIYKNEEHEVELSFPALSTTIVPNASTVTAIIETSTTENFAAIARTIVSKVVTGAGGTGVSALALRGRIPSDCERYVRGKVTFGASTTTGAALNGTLSVRF